MSLGRKQRITNEAWLEAVATVESTVSEAALGELVAATIEDIKAKTAGKKAAYAWSGGKDSIVLGKLCEAAGVVDSMIGVCDLEYPAFAAWIEANKPEGCEVINTHQGLDWLARHRRCCSRRTRQRPAGGFPSCSTGRSAFTPRLTTLTLSSLAAAVRTGTMWAAAPTSTPTARASPASARSQPGATSTSWPISITTSSRSRPSTGGRTATFAVRTPGPPAVDGQPENGWREVYDIDPSIVIEAAEKIGSARAFLEGVRV